MEWATHYQTKQDASWEGGLPIGVPLNDITDAGVLAQTAIFVPRHELGHEIKAALECGDLVRFGHLLDVHWQNKKARSGKVRKCLPGPSHICHASG